MLFDKFDAEAVNVFMYAQQETRSAKLGEVGTEQVLLGVLQCPENAKKALDRFGVTLDAMRDTIGVKKSLGDKAAELFRREEEPLPFTARSKACFKRAVSESEAMACEEVRPEHLFLAVARDEQSEARSALEKLGIEVDALCDAVAKDARKAKGSLVGVGGDGDERETTLASVGVDLTALALDGELDPCVGRRDEIARAVQILLRRRKSNPCLVGDAGVGKTAIAERRPSRRRSPSRESRLPRVARRWRGDGVGARESGRAGRPSTPSRETHDVQKRRPRPENRGRRRAEEAPRLSSAHARDGSAGGGDEVPRRI